MEILLGKANIDYIKLRKRIHEIVGYELSALTEPCYYPSLKRYYYELLNLCKLTETDIREYVKRFYKGSRAATWKLQIDPLTNFYIFLMFAFLKRGQINTYKSMMLLHVIRQYTNLMNKQIQFCNTDVFRYTIENLSKTHLFSREGTISNSLIYLSNEFVKNYTDNISSGNLDRIISFITECRTRISQSIKSFAELYYKASKEGLNISQTKEDEDGEQTHQQIERQSKVIDDLVKKITIYKVVDNKAVEESKVLTKIKSSLAILISSNLTKNEYDEDLRLIYKLATKEMNTISNLCGKEFYIYIKNLMSIKRTRSLIYFKKQVNELLLKILKSTKYDKEYNNLTKQTQSLINLYLAFYLTIMLRNSICF